MNTLVLLAALVCQVDTAGTQEVVLSSVILHNGNRACSATIFSVGPEWAAGMSAGHCFDGHIGGKFKVSFPDGTSTEAVLMVHRKEHDVAIFRVPSSAVLANSPIPSVMPSSVNAYESVGYPGGKGPFYQRLSNAGNNVAPSSNGFSNRWTFTAAEYVRDGHSGSGVFADFKLVGVVSEVDYATKKTLYCCPHSTLVQIIKQDYKKLGYCGKLLDDDEYVTDRQVNIKQSPNTKYFEQYDCGPNGCRLRRKAQAPAPPSGGNQGGDPPWLRPNIDVDNYGPITKVMPRKHEEHTLPKNPKQRSERIKGGDERQDSLEDRLEALETHRPKDGKDGRDGKDVVPEKRRDYIPAILAAIAGLCCGGFVAYKMGA